MLSMAPVSVAQASVYYQTDNYYTRDENEAASEWFGEGARAQGLKGEVDSQDFENVLAGHLPDGSVVGLLSNKMHRAGMDLTFSAPKSVSIMALVAGDGRITREHMAAVKETMGWAEKNFAEARIRSGETESETVKTASIVVALFAHDTSRALDPQLHVHAVMANATQTADGRWRAQHNDKFWSNNTLIGAVYHSLLRERIEALGYSTELTGKHGTFDIKGVGRETIELFSGRRAEILAKAAELGIESPQGLEAITIRTRNAKHGVADRDALYSTWEAMAASAGLDLRGDVNRAIARTNSREGNSWQDAAASPFRNMLTKSFGEIKTYIQDLTSNHKDNAFYVRPRKLPSRSEIAAAKSVASAVHHLSERETSFGKYDIAAAALHLGLQTNIHDIERQINRMQAKGILLPGKDEKLTTQSAREIERLIIAEGELGRGQSIPVVSSKGVAGDRLQAFALDDKGYALNAGQESAGRQILTSTDRFLNVQGDAGAGKSSMLKPTAHILQQEGKQVLVLGVQNVLVQQLSKEIDVPALSVAKFLGTHRNLLKPSVSAEKLEFARQQFRDSVIFIDESSMVSNDQALQLKKIANLVGIDLMVDIGDKRQLGAVEAGKPFELSQSTGVTTALMTENLRARAPDLRDAAFQANNGAIAAAFRTLKDRMFSVGDKVGEIASERWLRLSPEDRARTILMTSGRVLMQDVNSRVQEGLRAEGTLAGPATTIAILDKVQATRAELQSPATYEPGMRIEIQMRLGRQQPFDLRPQRGSHQSGTIISVDREKEEVKFRLDNGLEKTLLPRKLPLNKDRDPVRLSKPRQIDIHKGDKLRWTETDQNKQIFNGSQTTVLGITKDGVQVTNNQGVAITLPLDDPMLKRVNLAYALNTHQLQGATADNVIAAARASETNLANARNFLVNITRPRDGIEIIVDDADRYADRITRNPGNKSSALETLGEIPSGPSREALRAANSSAKAAGELPGQKLAASQSAERLYKPPERQPDITDRPSGGARTRDFER